MADRVFKLLSPHMTGEDVREFQRDLTARFKSWDISISVKDDGDYGTDTRDAAKRVCRGLGILHVTAMEDGVTAALRAKIKDPDTRTAREMERARSAAAKEFRAKLRERFESESHDAAATLTGMDITSWQPNSFTTFPLQPVGGHSFQVQILWGAAIEHGDHVHVGISRR